MKPELCFGVTPLVADPWAGNDFRWLVDSARGNLHDVVSRVNGGMSSLRAQIDADVASRPRAGAPDPAARPAAVAEHSLNSDPPSQDGRAGPADSTTRDESTSEPAGTDRQQASGTRPDGSGPGRWQRGGVAPSGALRSKPHGAEAHDLHAAANAIGLVAGCTNAAAGQGRVSDEGGAGEHGDGATDQVLPQSRNCVLACADQLTKWYERVFRINRIKADPTCTAIPAVELFRAANSASDFVETLNEVEDGFEDLPVGSSAIVGVKWKFSPEQKLLAWSNGEAVGHVFLARKVGESGIRYVEPTTGEESSWPPPWPDDEVEVAVVGYLDHTGKAVKPLPDTPLNQLQAVPNLIGSFLSQRAAYEPLRG